MHAKMSNHFRSRQQKTKLKDVAWFGSRFGAMARLEAREPAFWPGFGSPHLLHVGEFS